MTKSKYFHRLTFILMLFSTQLFSQVENYKSILEGDPSNYYMKISNQRFENSGRGHRTFDIFLCSKKWGGSEKCVYVNPMKEDKFTREKYPVAVNSYNLEEVENKLSKNKFWWYGIGSVGGMILGKAMLAIGSVNAGYMSILRYLRWRVSGGSRFRFVKFVKTKIFKTIDKLLKNEWAAHYALLSRTASPLGILAIPHVYKTKKFIFSIFSPTTGIPGMLMVPAFHNKTESAQETEKYEKDEEIVNEVKRSAQAQGILKSWGQFTDEVDLERVFKGGKVFADFLTHYEKFKMYGWRDENKREDWENRKINYSEWTIYHSDLAFQSKKKPGKRMSMVDYAFFVQSMLSVYTPAN